MINNKKGFFSLWGIGIVLVVALVFFLMFVYSDKFKFTVLGLGLVIISFVLLLRQDLSVTKKFRTGIFVVLLGVGLVFIFSSSVLQSVFSVSQVQFTDAGVQWVFTGSASSTTESLAFVNLPSTVTNPDTQVRFTPQEKMTLSIFKDKSDCVYQASKIANNVYSLGSFRRDATVYVIDNYGQEATLNMIDDSVQFTNVGSLTVKTQGGLISNSDCQSGLSTVVFVDNKNIPHYYDRSSWEASQKSLGILKLIQCLATNSCPQPKEATGFLQSFRSPPSFNTNEVRGEVNFANIVYTVTADAKYFKSLEFTQSKTAKPQIVDVDYQNQVQKDGTSSIIVKVKNAGDSGDVNVKAQTVKSTTSITPAFYSDNINSGSTKSFSFNVKAPNTVTSADIKVIACSVVQAGSTSCDEELISFNVIEGTPSTFCGDGKCQSNEDSTTCSADCPLSAVVTEEGSLDCGFLQQSATKNDYKYSFLGVKFGAVPVETCVVSPLVWTVLVLLVVGSLGYYAISITRTKRRK